MSLPHDGADETFPTTVSLVPEGKDEPQVPAASVNEHGASDVVLFKNAANPTLRDQEKVIDSLKKENFSLKLKVHFLEERLNQLAPEHIETAFKQNINLKIEVQSRGVELKKYKKLLLELEKELQNAQNCSDSKSHEQELKELLAEREHEVRELRRRMIVASRNRILCDVEARNLELEGRQVALEDQLEKMKVMMRDNLDEIDRLKDELVQKSWNSYGGDSRRTWLERKLAELEVENEDLRVQHENDMRSIRQREEEKDALEDELERTKLELEELGWRREAEIMERSKSHTGMFKEREEREAIEDSLNAVRDQLAATTIELQQREDELELKRQKINDMRSDHKRQLDVVDDSWRSEVENGRTEIEELRNLIAGRHSDLEALRTTIEELEDINRTAHLKYNAVLEQLTLKDDEIEAANIEIEQLGPRVWELEAEGGRLKENNKRIMEEAAIDREALEGIVTILKEKLASAKAQLQEVRSLYEQCREEVIAHREREEELGRDLAAKVQAEKTGREWAETDLETLQRHRANGTCQRGELEAPIHSSVDNVSYQNTFPAEHEAYTASLQAAIQNRAVEAQPVGESHTNDKLELAPLDYDVAPMEGDLIRSGADLSDKEAGVRDQEGQLERLHNTTGDLISDIATRTRRQLTNADMLDDTQGSLTETQPASCRMRVNDLEHRFSEAKRSFLTTTEHQLTDQLTERDTLLFTAYKYADKILGADKSPSKAVPETKHFANFKEFQDTFTSKLKALDQIQLHFERRTKEAEACFALKFDEIKKQLDCHWKQIDNFELKVKGVLDKKHPWKRKYMGKEVELETIKASSTQFAAHSKTLIKTAPNSKNSGIRATMAHNFDSDRHFMNTPNQSSSERNIFLDEKHSRYPADDECEARVKDYEARLKAADEKVRSAKQSGKERVTDLENHIKTLTKQIDHVKQRNAQLSENFDTKINPSVL